MKYEVRKEMGYNMVFENGLVYSFHESLEAAQTHAARLNYIATAYSPEPTPNVIPNIADEV